MHICYQTSDPEVKVTENQTLSGFLVHQFENPRRLSYDIVFVFTRVLENLTSDLEVTEIYSKLPVYLGFIQFLLNVFVWLQYDVKISGLHNLVYLRGRHQQRQS